MSIGRRCLLRDTRLFHDSVPPSIHLAAGLRFSNGPFAQRRLKYYVESRLRHPTLFPLPADGRSAIVMPYIAKYNIFFIGLTGPYCAQRQFDVARRQQVRRCATLSGLARSQFASQVRAFDSRDAVSTHPVKDSKGWV